MPFATDEEIKIAHDILLKDKKPFDSDKVNIIKEDSSCYVQACPGSGKTTTLLAKLIILANKMPLPEGKGICVLTHTNVAIDEIKAKLGTKADVLFRYPNFFGTIQTFLHKYVTAAALHYFYGSQITYVDDEMSNAVFLKKYYKLPIRESKLRGLIFKRSTLKEHTINAAEIEALGGVDMLTAANVIKKKKRVDKYIFQLKGYNWSQIPREYRSSIQTKGNSIQNSLILSFRVDWNSNKIITDSDSIRVDSPSGAEYMKIKEEMFREGILSFQDAYDLAFRYIWEKELDFSRFSDKRFKYLFIDEVQDCDGLQVDLIQKIFDENKVVIQRFGDYCQAIYERDECSGPENDKLKDKQVLHMHDSIRFGEKIAKPLRSLCMVPNDKLVGNDEIPSVTPIIITYEDPLSVLPKYVELLNTTLIPEMNNRSISDIANQEKREDPLHRINVKACGWVGKKGASAQKRYIESYFPQFEKKNAGPKVEGVSFNEFILKNLHGTIKEHATSIIQGILKYLDLCEIRNGNRRYTKTSFLEFLTATNIEQKENFLKEVMNWALLIAKSNSDDDINKIRNTIHQYIIETILPLYRKEETPDALSFFNAINENLPKGQATEHRNVYHGDSGTIDIEVSTVHAVKGETHAATLYLETFYNRHHESDRLAEQFKGVAYTGTDADTLKNLRVAYVGMSRPRYMLCVAIQQDRFDKIDCDELRKIWKVEKA
ncbi:hypothetical protein BARVI_03870 [Barnesiella viscericola DSM 18177]|uniref:UvrD-like helicase ATP-binding domain-containing protein n=1 Tax=Barnesiella viscericola DSM 18177 TaxID=880074 RepID=W0ESA7_9BACT|nr:UvrD-helicase domain-containing protein [Barnesiella viscericola]AHF13670.1 hypothetical protein BARVI_03870 [Barnesiella viscericola DSM 18177]